MGVIKTLFAISGIVFAILITQFNDQLDDPFIDNIFLITIIVMTVFAIPALSSQIKEEKEGTGAAEWSTGARFLRFIVIAGILATVIGTVIGPTSSGDGSGPNIVFNIIGFLITQALSGSPVAIGFILFSFLIIYYVVKPS